MQTVSPGDFVMHFPLFLVVYLAMSVQNAVAVVQGLAGVRSPFVRTPKANALVSANAYIEKKVSWITVLEMLMLAYCCFSIYLSFYLGDYFLLSFFIMFGGGVSILLYKLENLD